MELKGKRATVIGLGREGIALVEYLCAQGAQVTISDAKSDAELAGALAQIAGLPVRLSLGDNRVEDVISAHIVFVSPGVPLGLPALAAARQRGIPISSQIRLFFELCPAPVVGITGSSGKTTTTALVGEIFREAGWPVLVAGNIGLPPLSHLDELTPKHWVVLELSSFQLELMEQSPQVAVITNITPNHLDMHPTMEAYIAAKTNILRYQAPHDWAVLNFADPVTQGLALTSKGQALFFDIEGRFSGDGALVRDDWVTVRRGGHDEVICPITAIRLLGRHNLENVLTAATVASACGLPAEASARAIERFSGVEHRLELVAEVNGVRYYNDSIATSPERAVAGMRAIDAPIVLLAGGRDKHLPLEPLIETIRQRAKAVVLFGEMAPLLEKALTSQQVTLPVARCSSLEEALGLAQAQAQAGDVVLLSPGGTSFDLFRNYEERGQRFKELVRKLQAAEGAKQ